MGLIAWILLFWLLGSLGVAFFAMCLIRGGRVHEDEHAALEAKAGDKTAETPDQRAAVA